MELCKSQDDYYNERQTATNMHTPYKNVQFSQGPDSSQLLSVKHVQANQHLLRKLEVCQGGGAFRLYAFSHKSYLTLCIYLLFNTLFKKK